MAVAATVLLLAGCDDDEADRPNDADSVLPDCQEVWVEGEVLPADYAGCQRGATTVRAELHKCYDGSGRRIANYPGKGLFAELGGPIQQLPRTNRPASIDVC